MSEGLIRRVRQGVRLTVLVSATVLVAGHATVAGSAPLTDTGTELTSTAAGATDFYSSFERGDPQPDWYDTADTDAGGDKRAAGVVGPAIAGEVTGKVVAVRASGENPPIELKENLVDGTALARITDVGDRGMGGSHLSKWLAVASTGWVELQLSEPVVVRRYALVSANDAPERDPRDWTLSGSLDGETWTELDRRTGQDFPDREYRQEYAFDNETPYRHYRLDITANHGAPLLQLAGVLLSDGGTAPPDMTTRLGIGPLAPYGAKRGAGFTGLRALRYAGRHTSDEGGYSYNKVFDVNVPVTPTTELSYLLYPDFVEGDFSYPSTYAAVDLAFTDGSYLSELGARDQYGAILSPRGQGASKTLYADQWNLKRSEIGAVAAGKTIDRILVAYDNPDGPTDVGGWVDDIRIEGDPPQPDHDRPSDWVLTTRGTAGSYGFSRGNTMPFAAVPHGFNFWVPTTNAATLGGLYFYSRENNAANLPELQSLSLSHQPSPQMGDRQTFQVMPSAAAGAPPTDRTARALAFRHANETAKPHHYRVEFENEIVAEVAPTDHAAMFRFRFPGEDANLVFDNVNDQAEVTIDAARGVVTGWTDLRSGLSNGATRMFVYATLDEPIVASDSGPRQTGYAKFDLDADHTVTMRIATSLISLDQARRNLELEITPDDTFESVRERAQDLWDDKLDVIEVEGAAEDQLTTLYSNLYRLFLYPNSAYENVGTADEPVYMHAVQSSTSREIPPGTTATETGADVVPGKVYVNNGLWDTYRTTWPAYSLLEPDVTDDMVNGFVQQYLDGGWVARWSAPGYANLMTGTSSDVSFADAYVKGVPGIDARHAYEAALKNATVAPPGPDPHNPSVGRKGLVESIFLGYTPLHTPEGLSWALEGYINDFGIANMARKLAHDPDLSRSERRRLREESAYFRGRARGHVDMFDPAVGFFQGRTADGRWRLTPEEYDPREWGGPGPGEGFDYTETNGWGMAFTVPHDGRGLASLYGGRAALGEKLDTFFSIPETMRHPGTYGRATLEMIAARDVRMGQWAMSNQPAHHIPWMYLYAGQPWKTQEITREALRRLYVGSDIGQGYPGDEDNGEMSAWYVFSALGLYPLQVGSEYYAIGSPLFRRATVDLGDGKELVIKAPDNSQENVYVQGLTVDGKRHDRAYLTHEELADGAVLEFDMGPEPSDWATGEDAAPPSISDGVPHPLRDATGPGRGTATVSGDGDPGALFDDTSATSATLTGDDRWVEYRFRDAGPQRIRFYTLTSGPGEAAADPHGWVLKGSNDGRRWTTLDVRGAETFPWRSQTRPFQLRQPGNFSRFRIEFTGDGPTAVAEVELLATDRASGGSVNSGERLANPLRTLPERSTDSVARVGSRR